MAPSETATETMTNGEKSQSQFITHLTSYPVVSDTINAYKSNPYGAKSLNLADYAQANYIEPVLASKQVKQAGSYIHPYAARADSLGEEGLKKVESRFPIIKEDTATVTATVRETAATIILLPIALPLSIVRWGYDWLSQTYSEGLEHSGGKEGGLVAQGKAVVGLGLSAVEQTAEWARNMLAKAEKEGKEMTAEAREKLNKTGQDLSKKGQDAKQQISKKGHEAKQEVNNKAQEAKH